MINQQLIQKILGIDPANLKAYNTGLLQGKAYSKLHSKLSATLLPFQVSVPEWKLLGQVYENEKVKLSLLAELLSYDPPMITKLVKQLEKKSLLKRTPDQHDERAKVIVITATGKKVIEHAEPEVKKAMREVLKGITLPQLLTYLTVLAAIVRNSEE